MVALTEGNGSGTKLFQSLLDGHPRVMMIPGYPLMYFYPFWGRYVAPFDNKSWSTVLNLIVEHFAPIFDSRINPGSEDLDKLGENQDQYISIDVELFKAVFLKIVDGLKVNPRQCLIAIHYAYALVTGDDPAAKTVLVYHIHVFDYVARYLFSDFPNLKVIGSVRDPRHNLSRRELNSIVKPNLLKFREIDAFLMMPRAYRQATRFLLNGLDALSCVPITNCRVFKHEDLALRLDGVMRNTAQFLEIEYDQVLLSSSFAKMKWETSFYDFDTSNLVNPDILKDDWRQKETPLDIFVCEGINIDYLVEYNYAKCVYFDDSLFGRLRLLLNLMRSSRIECLRFHEVFSWMGLHRFLDALRRDSEDITRLRSYAGNMFYSLKWTNDGIDFSRTKLFQRVLGKPAATSGFRLVLARMLYWISGLIRYGFVLLRTPVERLLRIRYCLTAFWRRISNSRYLPDAL